MTEAVLQRVDEDVVEQLLLAVDVVVEVRLAELERVREVLHGHGGEALLFHEANGFAEDFASPRVGDRLVGASTSGARAEGSGAFPS